MKKLLWTEILLILLWIVGVWVVGGQVGAYLWITAVFVIAPLAVIALFIHLTLLVSALYRKKKVLSYIPHIAITIIFILPITVLVGASPICYPGNVKPEDEIQLLIPVEKPIIFGGKTYKTHSMWPSERYAYDILQEPYETGSTELIDYGIYGADVVAPISGTVIGVENEEPDILPGSESFSSTCGNYVFLKVDSTDTYVILTHLQKGSVCVNENSHVEAGELIGKVGNSGTSSEPHLHIQHQRNNPLETKIPICAEGLPIKFL